MAIETRFINASDWHKDGYLHYVVYASDLRMLDFLKQQLMQFEGFYPQKIGFKSFYKGFACVIYDTLKKEFFLIRDHFGFEPFYYTIINETKQLCFGSTLPDILVHLKKPILDEQHVEDILADICVSSLLYTDKTFYQNVFRVTPGHIFQLKILPQLKLEPHKYWDLMPGTSFIRYASDREYDDHFAALLEEACTVCCESEHIGLEFSGGMDTSVILAALDKKNISAELFMHIGEVQEERLYGEALLKTLSQSYSTHYVDADHFDVIAILDQHKEWFAGGAPYLFFMFAANIHQAVQQQGCRVLLSGFGGDECVSSHAPLRTWGAEVGFKALMRELNQSCLQALKWSSPYLYYRLQSLKSHRSALARKQWATHYKPYLSLQEQESDWLTGPLSYHVRMRIEYSAIVAKNRGFSYQYPLLYPPLVEYCFQLPPEQKRRQRQNRLLMRRYLQRHISSELFNHHQKCGDILPGTLPTSQELYKKGLFNSIFQGLPFGNIRDYLVQNKLVTDDRLFHVDLLRYMFK